MQNRKNMKKTLALLLGGLLLIACKSHHVHEEPVNNDDTMTAVNQVLEELKGRDVVLFVADQDEISPAEVPFPVVFTGMGKMRMFSGLVKWHETLPEGSNPVVLNIGSAGSAKYPIGTIVNCTRIFNGGCELVHDCIELPGDGASIFSGDYFMSTKTFSPEQVKALSQQYDLFDMEAYAVAQFCKMYDIPFYCLKAVSDNLDGNLKDWRSILADIRLRFTELLNAGDESARECDLINGSILPSLPQQENLSLCSLLAP